MNEGEVRSLSQPVSIGQGFAGKTGRIGVGKCTAAFTATVKGCPPSGAAILEFLRGLH
jgi:hypothetical protein